MFSDISGGSAEEGTGHFELTCQKPLTHSWFRKYYCPCHRLEVMWAGELRDKKETGRSPSCRPVGSEVGAKPSGSVMGYHLAIQKRERLQEREVVGAESRS